MTSEREAKQELGLEEWENDESASFGAQLKDLAKDIDKVATKHHSVLNKIISDSLSSEDIRRNCTENLMNALQRSVESGNVFRVELILAYLLVRECIRQRLA